MSKIAVFVNRLITHMYFYLLAPMRRLERYTNKLDNTNRFHAKYGRGDKCVITDCECKK